MFPVDQGFYMPAEWHPKGRTFMEFPVREIVWSNISEARVAYATVANAISEFEPVTMIVKSEKIDKARALCNSSVQLLELEHDDSWMRDNGPTFVINDKHEIAGVSWQFNAWGEKYTPYANDNLLANRLLEHLNIPAFNVDIILEGGAIHVDGQGTLITTKECVLNNNRNKNITCEKLEEYFYRYLNIKKVIWLNKGLYGDETDGHVDNVACFVAPGHVVIQAPSDKNDPNYPNFVENLAILKETTDCNDKPLEITIIPQPPQILYQGVPLTLSYINYYLVNGGLILPTFGGVATDTDNNAKSILQELFPERKIIPVNSLEIIKGGGNIHCITQQMPNPIL